jgi:hypothetical protein
MLSIAIAWETLQAARCLGFTSFPCVLSITAGDVFRVRIILATGGQAWRESLKLMLSRRLTTTVNSSRAGKKN